MIVNKLRFCFAMYYKTDVPGLLEHYNAEDVYIRILPLMINEGTIHAFLSLLYF